MKKIILFAVNEGYEATEKEVSAKIIEGVSKHGITMNVYVPDEDSDVKELKNTVKEADVPVVLVNAEGLWNNSLDILANALLEEGKIPVILVTGEGSKNADLEKAVVVMSEIFSSINPEIDEDMLDAPVLFYSDEVANGFESLKLLLESY